MEHERRHRQRGEEWPEIGSEVELEERCGHVGVRRAALVPADRVDLRTVTARKEESGEHLRRERPVRPHEVDERAACGLRDVVARRIAAEEDQLPYTLRLVAAEERGREAGAGAGEEDGGLVSARVDHRSEGARFGVERRRRGQAPIREPDAEPVVADDAMVPCELLVEAPGARVVPLVLEMRHPAAAEDEQRPHAHGGVGDPAAVQLAEADLLLHMTRQANGRFGPCQEDGPSSRGAAWPVRRS